MSWDFRGRSIFRVLLYIVRTNPEQSQPRVDMPPYLYGSPTCLQASETRAWASFLGNGDGGAGAFRTEPVHPIREIPISTGYNDIRRILTLLSEWRIWDLGNTGVAEPETPAIIGARRNQ
jgi:hypothetical protein